MSERAMPVILAVTQDTAAKGVVTAIGVFIIAIVGALAISVLVVALTRTARKAQVLEERKRAYGAKALSEQDEIGL